MLVASTELKPKHLKTRPFEIQPSKSPDFKCFQFSNGRISDTHSINVLAIPASPTCPAALHNSCFVNLCIEAHQFLKLQIFKH